MLLGIWDDELCPGILPGETIVYLVNYSRWFLKFFSTTHYGGIPNHSVGEIASWCGGIDIFTVTPVATQPRSPRSGKNKALASCASGCNSTLPSCFTLSGGLTSKPPKKNRCHPGDPKTKPSRPGAKPLSPVKPPNDSFRVGGCRRPGATRERPGASSEWWP